MSRKYRFGDPGKLHFISFAVVYWIDLFVRNEYREILIESWKYCQKEKDLEIYGWCIMTSHVHMIIERQGRDLDKIVGEMKSFTSRSLRKEITNNPTESRKEWLIWMMKERESKNATSFGLHFYTAYIFFFQQRHMFEQRCRHIAAKSFKIFN